MTEDTLTKVDINSASLEDLQKIPGVGRSLGARIIAGRPYEAVADLARVNGISLRMVADWESHMEVPSAAEAEEWPSPEPEAEPPAETPAEEELVDGEVILNGEEASVLEEEEEETAPPLLEETDLPVLEAQTEEVEAEPVPKPVSAIQKTQPPADKTKTSKPLLRSDALLWGGLAGVAGVILAVVLTLGILGLVNGGLRFVQPAQFMDMQRQVETLESQAAVLQQDMDALTTRVATLETLGGRVTDLEGTLGQLSQDLAGMQSSVETLNTQVDELAQQSGMFEGFLTGMQGLLNDLLPAPAPAVGE